jgi:hypothetical protein
MLSSLALTSGCTTPANCPTCGTTQNGSIVAINAMEVPQSSPFGKPFAVWDLVNHDPVNRRLYVTDRSHAAIAVFDTVNDMPIGQLKPNGGFVGSLCCEPDRISNLNEASGPNAAMITKPYNAAGTLDNRPFGNLWVSDGNSTVKVFNIDTDMVPVDHKDGTATNSFGVVTTGNAFTDLNACIRSGLGDPVTCGDLRADEPSFDPDHDIMIVTNGDTPANGASSPTGTTPFITMINTKDPMCNLTGPNSCVLAQFFLDGQPDGSPCPTPAVSGVTRGAVKCRHGSAGGNGLGGSIYNHATGKFLQAVPQVGFDPNEGEIMEIDPLTFTSKHYPLTKATGAPGCQVADVAIGPNNKLLVGCANREGEAFPPATYIMDVSPTGNGKIIKAIYEVGRVDQVWYNPGDQRFYLAARDMENGSFLGIIDAVTNMWLYNSPTGGNAHGVAVDPVNNHIYVPIGVNPRCGRFSAEGCISVYASP